MLPLSCAAGSGSDAASLITKAVYDPKTDEYVINGTKVFISGAGMHAGSTAFALR
jgi:alkylation response protein AidB-like acyl-CoA dehydrogenase